MSSSSSSQPIPPPLNRGLACLVCRKRKIRCDAQKPSCGACQKLQSTWKPESGTPKPICIYDPISPNAPSASTNQIPSSSSKRSGRLSSTSSNVPHSFDSSSSPPLAERPSLQSSKPSSLTSFSAQLQNPTRDTPLASRKRGPFDRSPPNSPREKQNVSYLLRSRSQSQSQSATLTGESSIAPQSNSSFSLTENDPFRTYSRLPRRASSPSLVFISQSDWKQGDAEGQVSSLDSPLPALLSTSEKTITQPSSFVLDRLVNLFFKYCSISSILRKDLYSVDKSVTGSDIEQALLRAILSIATTYSNSSEEVSSSLWKTNEEEEFNVDAQTVAHYHSSAARRLIHPFRGDESLLEDLLPVSLLLAFYGMQSTSKEEGLLVQTEVSWSAAAIRRLAFYSLTSSNSNDVPTVASVTTTSTLCRQRNTLFWAFYILDRQFQASRAVPSMLPEQVISTDFPSEDGQRISPSSKLNTSMSLDSSIFTATRTRDLSWLLFIKAVRLFSMCLDERLCRREDGANPRTSLPREILEMENQIQKLSSQIEKEVPKPFTHLSTIKSLVQASHIVSQESNISRKSETPKTDSLKASRAIAETARSMSPSNLKFADFFTINSFWIGGKSLIGYLAIGDNSQLGVSRDEIVEDLKAILACLWKHGPRGKLLTKSLMALYKTIESSDGFVLTPSFWPPEAKFARSNQESSTTSLLELSQDVHESESEFLNA